MLRQNSPGAEVGITLNYAVAEPASPSPADREATRHFDGYLNRWFTDPVFGRHYPADIVADYQAAGLVPAEGLPFVQEGDMKAIAAPLDFLGLNYYTRAIVRDATAEDNLSPTRVSAPAEALTEMGWEVYPEGLYNLLNRLHFEYAPPKLYITENGVSYLDGPNGSGQIEDSRRVRYLRDHLHAAHRAIANGVPLAGYFYWSFMDNFEWAKGYTQRFGIVWVDYDTQARLPKASAHWYADAIRHNGFSIDLQTESENNNG